MKTRSIRRSVGLLSAGFLALAVAACDTTKSAKTDSPKLSPTTSNPPTTPAKTTTPTTPAVTPATAFKPIYIKAGSDAPITDKNGIKWDVDTHYANGGSVIDRPDLAVTVGAGDTPEIYKSERYQMDDFHIAVPNGKYILKLHFSEDYDGIPDANGRIFTYAVKDGDAKTGKVIKEVKDFSPWKASGAQFKAYIDTVPVTVTNKMITITFTVQTENPQINAIEVLPG